MTDQYLDIIEVILVVLDTQAKITMINRKGYEVLGYEPGELEGENWFDICLPPDEVKPVYEAYLKIISGEIDPFEYYENRILTKNGDTYLVAWHNKLLTDESGKIIGTISSGDDITEKKRYENALRSLAINFADLSGKDFFEAASKHIALEMGVDYVYVGELTETKDSIRVLGGFACGGPMPEMVYELENTPCSDVISGKFCCFTSGIQQQYPNDLLLQEMGIESYMGAYIFDKERKSIGILVALHSKPLKNPETLNYLFTIFLERISAELQRMKIDEALIIEINERKLVEAELKLKQFAIDNAADTILWTSPDAKIIDANDAACLMLGYTREELLHLSIPNIDPNYTAEVWPKHFEELRQSGSLFFETVQRTKAGNLIPVEITANYIQFDDKELNCSFIRNISDRKQTEKDLAAAKNKAEESDRLKSVFLANMSHEIRTPMNGILGFADLLKEPGLSTEEQREYIAVIEKSGARMLNIINDIIDISKIEAGLMKVAFSEPNINELLEYIYIFFKPEVEAKGMKLSLKTTLPSNQASIKTDSEKVLAVLTNLVKNAIKYSSSGSIEIGYDLVKLQQGPYLQFYVRDTGIGIPKNEQKAVFQRFVQTKLTHKMAQQGAGLGLAITKAFVKMLGGKIWLESEEGIGSTFFFNLPYNSKRENISTIQNISPLNEKENRVNNLKILLAEDDKISELLMTKLLKEFGSEILKARSGVEAIEICRNNPDLDLILMDVQMPILNGYEATKEIRKFNSEVIIIAQTAFGLSDDRNRVMEAGCNDYISKPIVKADLQSLIRKYFE